MDLEKQKREYELSKFSEFLDRADLDIDRSSIASGNPNHGEPDILCRTNRGIPIAFELGRLTNPDLMQVQKSWHPEKYEFVRTRDHSGDIAKKKLKKKYKIDRPVNLLLYSEFPNGTPESMILERIGPMARSLNHDYEHVWYMGREIKMVYPADNKQFNGSASLRVVGE